MSENSFQERIRKTMRNVWHDHKHHDFGPGVPDLSFSLPGLSGWIEFKYAVPPAREGSVVRFVKGGNSRSWMAQKIWMRKRVARGGACFVAAEVGAVQYLFWAPVAGALFDVSTVEDLKKGAWAHWEGTVDSDKLVNLLLDCNNYHTKRHHAVYPE